MRAKMGSRLAAMKARVRLDAPLGARDLSPGTYVIGRAPECDVVVRSSLTSRHHAQLVVDESGATIEDLGTPNGTFVNGRSVRGARRLADADFIVVGDVALEIGISPVAESKLEGAHASQRPPPRRHDEVSPTQHLATIPAKAFEVLAATADPFFAGNQAGIAEKVLEGWLTLVLSAVKSGAPREEEGDAAALREGIRLAAALRSARWVDYVLELATALARPLDPEALSHLEAAVRSAGVSGQLLDSYVLCLSRPPLTDEGIRALDRLREWRAFAAPR